MFDVLNGPASQNVNLPLQCKFVDLFLTFLCQNDKSLTIKQKDESQKGCYKKTKHAKFSEKLTIPNP